MPTAKSTLCRVGGCGRGNHFNRTIDAGLWIGFHLPHNRPKIYPFPSPYETLFQFEKDNLLAHIAQQLPCRMRRVQRCFEKIEQFVIECKKEKPITKGEQKVIDKWVSECNEEVNEIGRLLCDKQSPPKKKIIIKLSKEENTKRKHRIEDDEPLNLVAERIRVKKMQ